MCMHINNTNYFTVFFSQMYTNGSIFSVSSGTYLLTWCSLSRSIQEHPYHAHFKDEKVKTQEIKHPGVRSSSGI